MSVTLTCQGQSLLDFAHLGLQIDLSLKKEKSRLDLWEMVKSCFLPRMKKLGIEGLKSTLDNSASFVYFLSNSNSPMWLLLS